ncbi:PIN domain-containing protein [Aequorivita xiaoshiensis]|uniref:PIN domain-containing protein n=1 Tax=Aequorivita xiaoshiensis TaxID=2874476 RepID=A0A9X1U5M6_9FLAO|nr:PIN domain-containing protein [Aequorivita xiaoshiensis]MCG2432180.1 PIN domain-containing protein [Aequorivita xiaoshiensis]
MILDTCSWLDLAKPKYSEILEELEEQISEGITILITCDIIIEEWERNKVKIINQIQASIKSYAKNALQISNYLPEKEKNEIDAILSKYRSIEKEQIKLAETHYDRVEKLLKTSQVYEINDTLKVYTANRALKKIAPFHNSKNNIADALIFFGATAYVEENYVIATDILFVSQNTTDFADPLDKSKIHPQLENNKVFYSNNIASAIKMRKEVIDELDEYNEYKFEEWVDLQTDIMRGK